MHILYHYFTYVSGYASTKAIQVCHVHTQLQVSRVMATANVEPVSDSEFKERVQV